MSFKETIKKMFGLWLDKELFEVNDKLIIKSEELRHVTGVVLVPEEVDLQGDIYSEDEIYKAMISFNTLSNRTKLQHAVDAEAQVIESWQTKSDEIINGKVVKKGTWLITMRLPPVEWEMVKNGMFTGFSVSCMARSEEIGEEYA